MSVKKRKWYDSHVAFGVAYVTEQDEPERPNCMICNLVMSNRNLKPPGLREHLENKHRSHVGTSIHAFNLRRVRYDQKPSLSSHGFTAPGKPLQEASYKATSKIAKEKKPHSIGDTLVKPCVMETAKSVQGEDALKQMSHVSLSNDTCAMELKK